MNRSLTIIKNAIKKNLDAIKSKDRGTLLKLGMIELILREIIQKELKSNKKKSV